MWKNFTYVFKSFKTAAILNLLGLSAAIFVFLVVSMQVYYDLTFNASIHNNQDIYQVVKLKSTAANETYISQTTRDEGDLLADKIPEIKNICYVNNSGYKKETIFKFGKEGEKESYSTFSTFVSDGFREIFNPQIVEGSLDDIFNHTGNTMISQSAARQLFGDESPLGKTVELRDIKMDIRKNDKGVVNSVSASTVFKPFTIKAVYKDYTVNTSINNGFITYRPPMQYLFYDEFYVDMDKRQIATAIEKMNTKEILDYLNFSDFRTNTEQDPNLEVKNALKLLPIRNIQINYPSVSQKGQNKDTVLFLLSIGLFALLIAYINFVNFTTAMAPARVRSVNIRMILGSGKNQLRRIITSEATLFTLCAFAIALSMVFLVQDTHVVELFKADISVVANWRLLATICITLLFLSLLIGIYPARYITNFNPLMALNSSTTTGIRSSKLRNTLMVVQLLVAICFTIIALFVKQQHQFLVHYNIGFEKENILALVTRGEEGKLLDTDLKTFTQEVMRNTAIQEYTGTNGLMGRDGINNSSTSSMDDKIYIWNSIEVSDHFFNFFNIPILEGSGFGEMKEGKTMQVVVNQEFLKLHQIENGLQGLMEEPIFNSWLEVVGIARNFNYSPLLDKMGSLTVAYSDIDEMSILYFKPAEGKTAEARKHIEETWKKFSSKEMELGFLDSNLEQLYQSQENISKAISVVSLIVILIAVMGVYGLITFQTKYRTKEIAIRKVNGAGVDNILYLLNRNLLAMYLFACLPAIVVTYFVVEQWLEQFPYRIGISPWVFLIACLLVFIVTTLTVTIQSYRAATANPVDSLKGE